MKEWLEQLCPEIDEWQVDLICEQVAKDIAAEREACARVCDEFDACVPIYIAAAIRARGEK